MLAKRIPMRPCTSLHINSTAVVRLSFSPGRENSMVWIDAEGMDCPTYNAAPPALRLVMKASVSSRPAPRSVAAIRMDARGDSRPSSPSFRQSESGLDSCAQPIRGQRAVENHVTACAVRKSDAAGRNRQHDTD